VKKGKQNRYIIFYIEDEKSIKVECVGDRNADYDQFLADLVILFAGRSWFRERADRMLAQPLTIITGGSTINKAPFL
jgi:hypothetical protein